MLHAPDAWQEAVRGKLGEVDVETVETWAGSGVSLPMIPPSVRAKSKTGTGSGTVKSKGAVAGPTTRRLLPTDSSAFALVAPPWALRGWRTFPSLIENGAAFGVPYGQGFASIAWVFDRAENFDGVAVATLPKFQRLGLGRASAVALIDHAVHERGQVPLWSTTPDNAPSLALANALGFSVANVEALLRWPPRAKADDEPDTDG